MRRDLKSSHPPRRHSFFIHPAPLHGWPAEWLVSRSSFRSLFWMLSQDRLTYTKSLTISRDGGKSLCLTNEWIHSESLSLLCEASSSARSTQPIKQSPLLDITCPVPGAIYLLRVLHYWVFFIRNLSTPWEEMGAEECRTRSSSWATTETNTWVCLPLWSRVCHERPGSSLKGRVNKSDRERSVLVHSESSGLLRHKSRYSHLGSESTI